MKEHLTTDDPAGWYECSWREGVSNRFPNARHARYWDGQFLYCVKAECNIIINDRDFTNFVALVPAQNTIGELLNNAEERLAQRMSTKCPECGGHQYFADGDWDQETGEKTAEYMLCRDCGYSGDL